MFMSQVAAPALLSASFSADVTLKRFSTRSGRSTWTVLGAFYRGPKALKNEGAASWVAIDAFRKSKKNQRTKKKKQGFFGAKPDLFKCFIFSFLMKKKSQGCNLCVRPKRPAAWASKIYSNERNGSQPWVVWAWTSSESFWYKMHVVCLISLTFRIVQKQHHLNPTNPWLKQSPEILSNFRYPLVN